MTYRCTITGPHNHSSLDDPIDCDRADRSAYLNSDDFYTTLNPTPDEIRAAVSAARHALADLERRVRDQIAAEIDAFADDHSDVSDAYRHAALIAKGIPGS